MFRCILQSIFLIAVLFPTIASAGEADSRAYRLAPGDRITVTVFGQPDLSGDFLIDDAGTVSMPLIGPVEVKELTTLESQRRIGERLADGILQAPSVSVRIAELRPLYVLGDVRLPGAYPFRYGSTVQSAVALAGGFGPAEVLRSTAVADFMAAEERVRQLSLQQRTLLVRRARLEAQRDGQDSFTPPDLAGSTDDKDTVEMVANEKDVFSSQATILRDQIATLRSQKPHLQEQIDADNGQSDAGKKQLELIRQQVDRYGSLVAQGLGTKTNDFQFRVLEANEEANVWRLHADVSRLQMQSAELDFKIQEIDAAFKRQVATELQQTRDRLTELEVALPAAIRYRDVKLRYAGGAAQNGKRQISISRMENGHTVVLNATETTPVEPGDVINIETDMLPLVPHDEAAVGPSASRPRNTEEAQAPGTSAPISR
ncbi:hypothetical protein AS156_05080 [Bradyrhizobium macuxiense]|uniref:Uncharacterized protein n=1 Tax=Bradyrhizobium macuxiense TaxID=1755647 RepID=A0A125Q923_9BRAD|nr:hypothetical protein AS156_05080 [Bradyrhizobium macuxiense]